jgi:hypothetical protein
MFADGEAAHGQVVKPSEGTDAQHGDAEWGGSRFGR